MHSPKITLKLRHKVFLVVVLCAFFMISSLFFLSKVFLEGRFGVQEHKSTQAAFMQTKEWLEGHANSRMTLAGSWGTWDDSWNQIDKPSDEFRKVSLKPSDVLVAGNSIYLMFDTAGVLVDQVCPREGSDSAFACPAPWVAEVLKLAPQWHQKAFSAFNGFVAIDTNFYAIGVAEVVPHTFKAPQRGFVVMGERLQRSKIPIPGGLGRIDLRLAQSPSAPQNQALALALVGPDSIEGSALLPGFPGMGGLEVRARMPRIVYQEGKDGLLYLLAWMLGLGAIALAVLMTFLGRSVVARIEALREDLARVGERGQGARVSGLGKDDIGVLAMQVNDTLEKLDATRAESDSRLLKDSLTGLSNRTMFLGELSNKMEQEERQGLGCLSMVLITIDRFQKICDTYGPNEGDQFIMTLADRLLEYPGLNLVARVSHDGFAVVLDKTDDINAITRVSESLRKALEQPIILGRSGKEVTPKVFIGISMMQDMQGIPVHESLRRGEASLHNLQKAGASGSVALFDPELDRMAREQMDLEKDLRRAVENNEFMVAFQPIINVATHKLAGFESLVRWKHPTKGLISPLNFIPLAEETGLIEPIGQWVLRESCRQMVAWSYLFEDFDDTFISVNLSVRQFRDPNLHANILDTIKVTGFPLGRLKLEITESAMMDNPADCARRLKSLTDLGIRLSLDDFGTGYSSLGYLDRFPVHTIKLDKSFVDKLLVDIDAPIVRSVVAVAQVMDYELVAEGVERQEQAESLERMKCGYIQGYLFGKPMFADAIPAWVTAQSKKSLERILAKAI
jgi:diguanylate cyclase (GGDEF)-like protein